jgi:hypothetical protein
MATMIAAPRKLRADDIFFPAMALLILAVVVIGFAQSYFLPGLVFAKLPNKLVHIHGALFVSWIFLLLIQNSLVAARKVKAHMTLGVLALILPPLMAIFGVLTLFDSIRRNGTGIPGELIFVGDIEELLLFLFLVGWAMLARRTPAMHKRLMTLATLALMGPAVNRWPFPPQFRLPGTILVCAGLPFFVVAYDLITMRKLSRATWVGTLLIVISIFTIVPVSNLPVFHRLVAWIMHG